MKRLTQEERNKIKKLHKEGESYLEIAKEFKISHTTARYHCLTEEQKKDDNKKRVEYFRNLPLEVRRKKYLKQKEYNKNYRRKRYEYDPEFREKITKRQREYQRKKYWENKK